MCTPSTQKNKLCFWVLCKFVFFIGLFGYIYLLVPMTKNACRMALASNIQKYTFKIALGPCKQYFVMFSEGLKLSSRSDIYTTWGMARAGLSSCELGADLSAWLAKITARLSGLMALSWAIYITTLERGNSTLSKCSWPASWSNL